MRTLLKTHYLVESRFRQNASLKKAREECFAPNRIDREGDINTQSSIYSPFVWDCGGAPPSCAGIPLRTHHTVACSTRYYSSSLGPHGACSTSHSPAVQRLALRVIISSCACIVTRRPSSVEDCMI